MFRVVVSQDLYNTTMNVNVCTDLKLLEAKVSLTFLGMVDLLTCRDETILFAARVKA